MFRLTMMIRGILWLMWFATYITVASWVGEGLWSENSTRFFAAILGAVWSLVGFLVIEDGNGPARLAKMLMEDDA